MEMSAMPSTVRPARSRLFRNLERITSEAPLARKRLVGPDINWGRELLSGLARDTGGWIGWEAANLRGIAEELAFVPLSERGLRAGNDIEIGTLINRALDRAIEEGAVGERFAALQRNLGFRRALGDSLLELRTAGVGADALRQSATPGSPAHDVPAVLERYQQALVAHRLTDPAGVFAVAIEEFDREAPFVLDGVLLLAPTLRMRGLPGRLLAKLLEHGARALDTDPLHGAPGGDNLLAARSLGGMGGTGPGNSSPHSAFAWLDTSTIPDDDERLDPAAITPDFFVASTPCEELREVCRRVAGEGLSWDEVEIVATDVDAYGVALDALCQQVGMKATMLHGVPLERTGVGRALDRWFRWLEGGLPANVLRQALEAGELEAPGSEVVPTALARELRRLRIGWGRARYESALTALNERRSQPVDRHEDELDEEYAARVNARRRSNDGLSRLLTALLSTTPPVPELGSSAIVRISSASLARHTVEWLTMVPTHDMAEQHTVARLRTRLEHLAAGDDEATPFSSALATLREGLADLRAWPMLTSERKPWSASGGMVHLTDFAHGGTTLRKRTFVVGLDAGRAGGSGRQDPLLPDSVRQAIGRDALLTSSERRRESGWLDMQALASLRGRVTLSYAIAGAVDGRESGPAPLLLQAWRVHRRDATLSYEQLREALGVPACAVPDRGAQGAEDNAPSIDARDAWLAAIADGPLLLDATTLLAGAFPTLTQGLLATELAAGPELTGYHGLIPAAAALGPALDHGAQISPSALEKLASCPLAWFYRYGLALYLPEDPEYDAEHWLLATHRGSLLHEVFEEFVIAYRGRQAEIADDAARRTILEITERRIARWREQEPPPGMAVFDAECAELKQAALSFLQMERDLAAGGYAGVWLHTELKFGGDAPAGRYQLPDGTVINLKGTADRIDELPDGSLVVIDYKTGGGGRYKPDPKGGPFNGGRHLQPALYAAAVGALLSRRVARFEYRFPTPRGENDFVQYPEAELEQSREIIAGLLNHVHDGHFIPTTDDGDCSYCDYGTVCRTARGRFKSVSPRAAWANENAPELAEYRTMLERRRPRVVT